MAVIEGEYHWHRARPDIDEFFFVLDGKLLVDLEDRTVELTPRQGFVVSKGIRHRTRAPQRTVILMVERNDIVPPAIKLLKIVSGGQTGVDRAALDVALEHGIPCGGWCPAGRLDELGRIPDKYPVQELPGAGPNERTLRNVIDSHGSCDFSQW